MASERETLINEMNVRIGEILRKTPSEYTRTEELGTQFSFGNAEPLIADAFRKLMVLQNIDLSEFPFRNVRETADATRRLEGALGSLTNFNPLAADPSGQRRIIETEFYSALDNFIDKFTQVLTINNALFNNLGSDVRYKSFIDRIELAQAASEQAAEEIHKLLDAAKTATANIGASKYSTIFEDESRNASNAAFWWMFATIVIIITVVLGAFVAIQLIPQEKDLGAIYIVQYSLTKVLIFSGLFYALAICSKNYKAQKHNQVVNKHRQNALTTFETFVKAADHDEQTKNAILLEVTRTIFASQQTGYLSPDGDSDSPNKIIEIFKTVSSNSGK